MNINTKEDFKNLVNTIEATPNYQKPLAFSIGIRRKKKNTTLDVYYPLINYKESFGTGAIFKNILKDSISLNNKENTFTVISIAKIKEILNCFKPFLTEINKHPNVELLNNLSLFLNTDSLEPSYYAEKDLLIYFLYDQDTAINSIEEAYFKLSLISHRKAEPHQLNLAQLFPTLKNIAWTNKGPILVEDIAKEQLKSALTNEPLTITHVDKFPYLLNYHVPTNTRICSGSQVRLGAYLGEGTTVMPAGYINFNAGTKGDAMIEGRISAGVVIGKHSDVGGGASIMGTLSGGNKNVISIGEKCLLGANAGTGISLGNGCTIAAGVYVTAGAKVYLYDQKNNPIDKVGQVVAEGKNITKAIELSGKDNLLFLMNSETGKLICKPNQKIIKLNKELHTND